MKAVIAVAGRSVPLTEVELELKSGDEPDLYDLAMSLAEELPLRLDFVSKGERGFRAIAKNPPPPSRPPRSGSRRRRRLMTLCRR